MTSEARYFAADAEYQAELTRRRIGEVECDPLTVRYLLRLGVGDGWRCLEVGAGAGSIVRWLSDRVGPNGSGCRSGHKYALPGRSQWGKYRGPAD